jgi:hypothetical protein
LSGLVTSSANIENSSVTPKINFLPESIVFKGPKNHVVQNLEGALSYLVFDT